MFWERDNVIEVRGRDCYVLAPWQTRLDFWLERGYEPLPYMEALGAIFDALRHLRPDDLERAWTRLSRNPAPRQLDVYTLENELDELLSFGSLVVLRKQIERGIFISSAPKLPGPPQPQRTNEEHWLAIEAVNELGKPVAGVQLELLVAGGEVKTATTGNDGIARVERILAGRAVIRVLNLDGGCWRPVDGEAKQASGTEGALRWHLVRQGECLSRIAHHYAVESWRSLWSHPKNEPLKMKRKSPHVLLPGDQVAIPGSQVHEIIRATDAMYRIEVKDGATLSVAICLRDFNGIAFDMESYELSLPGGSEPQTGATDAQGILRATVPVGTPYADIRCPDLALGFRFFLSNLDTADGGKLVPVPNSEHAQMPEHSSISGLQARLNALGYDAGPVTDRWSPQTQAALAWFQTAELGRQGEQALAWNDETDATLRERVGA